MTENEKKVYKHLFKMVHTYCNPYKEDGEKFLKENAKQIVESLSLPSVMVSLPKFVDAEKQKAWDKMGDTGNQHYCTDGMQWNEENYWFGYFRAMEEIKAQLEKNGE